MATKVASLFAEIGAQTEPFEKGSKKVKGGLEQLKSGFSQVGLSSVASFLSIGGAVAGAAALIKNASDETMKYAREVRDLAAVSGTGAEASSRLLQVLDDYELTAQDVTAATRFMTKAGLTPTIETLAQLSDQYNAINDPMQQNEFILKNLGRGGLQWVNVLKQGGSALMEQSKAVNANLILTDQQIKETERYRLAIDNMQDTIMGWKVSAVTSFLDVSESQEHAKETLLAYGNTTNEVNGILQRNAGRVKEVSDEYTRAALYGEAWEKALKGTTQAVIDNDAVLKDFNTSMDDLGNLIDGELGPAQDDYNQKIAEYSKQLAEAKSKEDKMGIQAQIDAETEAYNKRANSIIFNIQQQAILNEVQNHPELAEKATSVLTDLAYTYGLVDEKQKAVADSTNAAINQFAATGNMEVFEQQLKNIAQGAQESSKPIDNLGDNVYHTGKRSVDTAGEFGVLADSAATLGEAVSKDAVGPVSALKSGLNGMPASGTSWDYLFNISVHGSVPRMPSRGSVSGPGAGQENNAGNQEFAPGAINHWSGGHMSDGWNILGDAPGGGFTQFTEAIGPDGKIYDAKDTRRLKEMGVLDGAKHNYFVGGSGDIPISTGSINKIHKKKPGGSASATAPDKAADQISGNVAADVSASVSGAIGQSAAATVSATVQNNASLKQINDTLSKILNKLPGASETLGNDIFIASLNS